MYSFCFHSFVHFTAKEQAITLPRVLYNSFFGIFIKVLHRMFPLNNILKAAYFINPLKRMNDGNFVECVKLFPLLQENETA